MEITWYGHSCFRLRDRKATVVTDPYDKSIGYSLPRIRADIVTLSHDHPHHTYVRGVKGDPKVISGPGEYEVKGVFITGIPTFHDKKKGSVRGRNTVFLFDFDDLTVCHLGDLGHVPTQSQVELLNDIDVLLIPVVKVDSIGKLFKEMGLGSRKKPQENLKVTKKALPDETQVVVLAYKQG